MNVAHGQPESAGKAWERVAYCLDRLEEANGFNGGIEWSTKVAPALTIEELVGALVAAEIELSRYGGYEPLIADFERGWV